MNIYLHRMKLDIESAVFAFIDGVISNSLHQIKNESNLYNYRELRDRFETTLEHDVVTIYGNVSDIDTISEFNGSNCSRDTRADILTPCPSILRG